jgi:hypothetical protein
MDHRWTFAKNSAAGHFGEEEVMIPYQMAARHLAEQICHGLIEHRRSAIGPVDLQLVKRWLPQIKSSSEMSNHIGLGVVKNVEREV